MTNKSEIIKKYGTKKADTGSSRVQVAILTSRISELTEHLKLHKKDLHSRRGLITMVNKRRKLLDYLKKHSSEEYSKLIKDLGIRR